MLFADDDPQADRNVDVAGKSTLDGLSSPLSDNAAETLAPKADIESESIISGRRRSSSLFSLMAARTGRRAAGDNEGGNTKSVGPKEDLSNRDGKTNSEEDAPDSGMTARVKRRGFRGNRERNTDSGANALGEEDEIIRPDGRNETVEGRFEIMRSRMKKASEDLIKKGSSSARLKKPVGKGGWSSSGRLHDKAAPGGEKSAAEENKRRDTKKVGRSLHRHQDDSGSIRCEILALVNIGEGFPPWRWYRGKHASKEFY